MTIRFDYPDSGSPTDSVVLASAHEQLPLNRPLRRMQTRYTTDAGAVVVYDWGDSVRQFQTVLFPLSAAERTALEDFFDTVVNASAETFDITLDDGVHAGVRFLQDVIDIQRQTNAHYRVALTLRVG